MKGNCPSCQKTVLNCRISEMDGTVFMGRTWRTISFNCPMCNTILGVQIDPIAVKTDVVNELFQKLRGS